MTITHQQISLWGVHDIFVDQTSWYIDFNIYCSFCSFKSCALAQHSVTCQLSSFFLLQMSVTWCRRLWPLNLAHACDGYTPLSGFSHPQRLYAFQPLLKIRTFQPLLKNSISTNQHSPSGCILVKSRHCIPPSSLGPPYSWYQSLHGQLEQSQTQVVLRMCGVVRNNEIISNNLIPTWLLIQTGKLIQNKLPQLLIFSDIWNNGPSGLSIACYRAV
jgi:hypothetical protein